MSSRDETVPDTVLLHGALVKRPEFGGADYAWIIDIGEAQVEFVVRDGKRSRLQVLVATEPRRVSQRVRGLVDEMGVTSHDDLRVLKITTQVPARVETALLYGHTTMDQDAAMADLLVYAGKFITDMAL